MFLGRAMSSHSSDTVAKPRFTILQSQKALNLRPLAFKGDKQKLRMYEKTLHGRQTIRRWNHVRAQEGRCNYGVKLHVLHAHDDPTTPDRTETLRHSSYNEEYPSLNNIAINHST
jgi:hypothetical protein